MVVGVRQRTSFVCSTLVAAPFVTMAERFFIKSGEKEKGPFDAETLLHSLRAGRIQRTTLVRAENETTFVPLGEHHRLSFRSATKETSDTPTQEEVERIFKTDPSDSFGKGLVSGMLEGASVVNSAINPQPLADAVASKTIDGVLTDPSPIGANENRARSYGKLAVIALALLVLAFYLAMPQTTSSWEP